MWQSTDQQIRWNISKVFKWWCENQTEKSLFMAQNVWYWLGPPIHVTLPFEYQTTILSSIHVFGIQIATVFGFPLIMKFKKKADLFESNNLFVLLFVLIQR